MSDLLISSLLILIIAGILGCGAYSVVRQRVRTKQLPVCIPEYALQFPTGLRVVLKSGAQEVFLGCTCHYYAVYRGLEEDQDVFLARVAHRGGFEVIKRYTYSCILDLEHLN